MQRIKYFFKKLFGVEETFYDESSDCFDAMKKALEMYKEMYGQLYISRQEAEKREEKRKELSQKEIQENNSKRYTLQYLYKQKR